jgi:hypothetical protein
MYAVCAACLSCESEYACMYAAYAARRRICQYPCERVLPAFLLLVCVSACLRVCSVDTLLSYLILCHRPCQKYLLAYVYYISTYIYQYLPISACVHTLHTVRMRRQHAHANLTHTHARR